VLGFEAVSQQAPGPEARSQQQTIQNPETAETTHTKGAMPSSAEPLALTFSLVESRAGAAP